MSANKWIWKCTEEGCMAESRKPLPHCRASLMGRNHLKHKHDIIGPEPILIKESKEKKDVIK